MPDNIYTLLDESAVIGGLSSAELINRISAGQDGMETVTVRGDSFILKYAPTSVSGWNLITVMPSVFISSFTRSITITGYQLALKFGIVFLIIISLLIWYGKVTRRHLICLNKTLADNNERINFGINKSSLTVFEYDIVSSSLTFTGDSAVRFGMQSPLNDVPESIISKGFIQQDYYRRIPYVVFQYTKRKGKRCRYFKNEMRSRERL
jgi:hypothetical protein